MEEYKTNNKKWLELLNELRDIAAFLDTKEMESNADVIRTAIDLLKYLNPECHSKVSEFESDKIREILKPKFEVIAYFKNGQCFATTGADAVVNDIELKVKDKIGNITAIINRAETLAITCNKVEEEAQ